MAPQTPRPIQAAKELTGRVTSASGEVLPGVTVMLKGTPIATTTNEEGIFSLSVPEAKGTLVFSYIGYITQELPITKATVYNIKMAEDAQLIKEVEVVNIGYGEARRADVTGAIGSVNMQDLYKAPVKSFDEALAGRVAGVQVTSSEGQPGSPINIIIRGANSLTQENSPLYVIDGFPSEDAFANALNPDDIETIDVLKDASATAIYGARGANGVVLITTKRGRIGEPVITYNGYYGIQESRKRMEVLSPYEFVKLQYELSPSRTTSLFLQGRGAKGEDLTLEDYRNRTGLNWEDQVMQTAPIQNHSLALRGGTKKTLYSVSLSYMDQEGIMIKSGFNRFQSRLTLDQEISDKLKAGVNASYSTHNIYGTPSSANAGSAQSNLLYNVWSFRPVAGDPTINLLDLLENAETEAELSDNHTFNPVLSVKNEIRDNTTETLIGNAYLEYKVLKDLKLKITGGVTRSTRQSDYFNGPNTRSAQFNNKVNGGTTIFNTNTWVNENTLTYTKRVAKNHLLNLVGGYTMQGSESVGFGASAIQLPNDNLELSGLDEGVPNSITATSSEWTLASFLGRFNYNYKSKYFFTASFRADGSSKFSQTNKWSHFPSMAVSWRLENEKFVKDLKFISTAKLRASWGITGNNRIGDFAYLPKITLPQNAAYYFNNSPNTGSFVSDLGNSDLKWESTEASDLGLDLAFFNHRVSVSADLYQKTTHDLLLFANLPTSMGYNRGLKNVGKTRNQGLEITIGLEPIRGKEFTWTTDFNISFNRSKVLALAQNEERIFSMVNFDYAWPDIPAYVAKINEPVAQIYGLIWDGVYNYEDFDVSPSGIYTLKETVPTNGAPRESIKPGDIKYKDINGDGIISITDKTVIGDPNPVHYGGLSNNFSYKGFDLHVFFQWSYGNDIINANRVYLESGRRFGMNQFASFANRWTPENPTSNIPRASGQIGSITSYSSLIVEDGSFIRFKTVQLSYTIPKHIVDRVKIKNMKVYAAAQNLFTWTNYSGYDPEVSVRPGALTPGFDYSAYPRARTTTLGVNVTF
ncbi:SusC/RagA family TonB-linked outer membrane protein [Rufibacter glacialis]|uniref:SusC/RagA family TonB-linked outer membrane protein n=1 Tax=Rufibacter glacialis TaxID=1259555 RepID=A0A5M8QKP3_9BACT|nr:TonB-dependent receptor [Rufibacter glacialis]KAA6435336.1 TonB-dependent receptor [Rufibacter glacialis]GGK62466.1 SusC/RagA family TonB-linked outer membrane protein [Rufibacter glacialis]